MKTTSDIEIPVFQNLGTNRWYYHFNHSSKEVEDIEGTRVENSADTVIIVGEPTIEKINQALQKEGLISETLQQDFEAYF